MTYLDETVPAGSAASGNLAASGPSRSLAVYDTARRWLAETGGPPGPLDNHQVWAVVQQRYPGGWAAFISTHQERS